MEGSVLGGSIAGGPSFASRFRTTAMGGSTGKFSGNVAPSFRMVSRTTLFFSPVRPFAV
jgi:hypothetical protein